MNTNLFNWYVDRLDGHPHIAGDIVKNRLGDKVFVREQLISMSGDTATTKRHVFKLLNQDTFFLNKSRRAKNKIDINNG